VSRRAHRPEAVEVIEMLALIPQTSRKALRVARVRQGGVDLVELRLVGLDPAWAPSPLDHRTTIRTPALRRVLAALQAAEAKAEVQS
jgi:hypothetical protein